MLHEFEPHLHKNEADGRCVVISFVLLVDTLQRVGS